MSLNLELKRPEAGNFMEGQIVKAAAPESRYLENITVLLIEPNAFMRSTIRRLLTIFGCRRVVEATDGADGLKAMKGAMPDLIVTEWEMEPISGIDFTKTVRALKDGTNRYVPIIMTTAHSAYGSVIQARDSGITEFVVKPLSAKSLMTHIIEAIERPRGFIETETYFGPDRRRRNRGDFTGDDRRGSGTKRPGKPINRDAVLNQEQVDEVVAGDKIEESGAAANADSTPIGSGQEPGPTSSQAGT